MAHHYFVQFLAYTMAMVGFLSLCLIIYKKFCLNMNMRAVNETLSIENAIRLSPGKQIFIIRAGKERFLVASDTNRTTMLAKLEEQIPLKQDENSIQASTEEQKQDINSPEKEQYQEELFSEIEDAPIMKRIMEKMKKKAQ